MKKFLTSATVFLFFGAGANWFAGTYLSHPVNHPVKMPGAFLPMAFNGTHGSILKTEQVHTCALLLHGVRSDRTSMIARAEFLKTLGITSALIDLQAHDETSGEHISFGYFESKDAANGLTYLKTQLGCKKVLAIGHSLGGAAALLSPTPLAADALILESVYPTIEDAVADRLESKIGNFARALAPLLYLQIPLRIHVPLDKLRPINALKHVTVPVFIIGGSLDLSTKAQETTNIYEAVTSKKQLWIVEGAKHEDIYAFTGGEYEMRLKVFIEQSL